MAIDLVAIAGSYIYSFMLLHRNLAADLQYKVAKTFLSLIRRVQT